MSRLVSSKKTLARATRCHAGQRSQVRDSRRGGDWLRRRSSRRLDFCHVLLIVVTGRAAGRRRRIDGTEVICQALYGVHARILVRTLGDLGDSAERHAALRRYLPLGYRLGAQVAHHEGVDVWELVHIRKC